VNLVDGKFNGIDAVGIITIVLSGMVTTTTVVGKNVPGISTGDVGN